MTLNRQDNQVHHTLDETFFFSNGQEIDIETRSERQIGLILRINRYTAIPVRNKNHFSGIFGGTLVKKQVNR